MIIPTILEKDFEEIKRKVELIDGFTQTIQIDFADGVVVDGLTFLDIHQLNFIETKSVFDIDLMVKDPSSFLTEKIKCAKSVSFHIEAGNTEETIKNFRDLGYKVGLSINPETSTESLYNYINNLDYVQFLSVKPGGQGRKFEPKVTNKISKFKRIFPDKIVQVDGGINETNIRSILNVGTDNVVIGSAIFGSENPREKLREFQEIAKNYEKR